MTQNHKEGVIISENHFISTQVRVCDVVESERAKRTHCCTLIDIFVYILYMYNYSVTKNLRKIRATTFTENYGKLRVRGMSERRFQLVLVA